LGYSAVKEHIFTNTYELGESEPTRFDADYHMAVSWQRLMDGKNIQDMDVVLLRHELLERHCMIEKGMSYFEAHALADSRYGYATLVREADR